jgi:predicted dehydrogenase
MAQASEIVAVCDSREESARSLSTEYGIPAAFTEMDRALGESGADAVYVATPVWLHAQHAIQALEAGKHVLVEKPLGLTGQQCERVLSAARVSELRAGCSYYRRAFPSYQHAKDMIDRSEFGQVVLVRMTYFSWFNPTSANPKYWRVLKARSGGGPLSDMGTHMFDVLIGLFGLPTAVYASCGNLVHQWDVEDTASIQMKLANGAHVLACFSWGSKTWRHEFEIVGTEAKVYWHPYDSGQVTKTVGRQVDTLDLSPAENVHLPLVEDFVQAVREGRQPICPLDEAAKTNILLDSIYQSASENRPLDL